MRPYYFLGNGRGLTRLSTGEVFFVDTDAHDISTWIILGGVWETFVDDILCALIRPGDTFLDVGANMGYYTVKMAARVGDQGRVYSFEPNPRLFRLAFDNIRINGFSERAVVTNAAAGAVAGTSHLTFEHNYPGGGMVGLAAEQQNPEHSNVEVSVVRIDDVIPPQLPVHLIKIDVEGFEPLVLQGMMGVLARSPDAAIVTEVNYLQWRRHGAPAELLKQMAGQRRIFRIFHDGTIEPLPSEGMDAALDTIGVSYVLLLPANDARWEQVRRFDRNYGPPTPEAVVAAGSAPVPNPSSEGQPSARPSGLMTRVRRKLASVLAS